MNLQLQDKVYIVSGAGSGIGKAVSLRLALEGAIVCLLDNNENALLKTEEEIARSGGRALSILTELTNTAQCQSAIHRIQDTYHQIDGLVNNAGINDGVSLEQADAQRFLDSLNKNVAHYHTLVELSLPALEKSCGAIVNICSKIAETGQGGSSGYAAANGARMALTEYWAHTFAPRSIRVNGVVVSECWTPQYEWWIGQLQNGEARLKQIISKIPLENRMTTPQEVADTVLFLLSEKSEMISGQFLYVDGGYVHLDRALQKA